jgi:hypothetical protein
VKIVPLEDDDAARELHKLAFPFDNWPDPVCTSWAMDGGGKMLGYVAAKVDIYGQLFIERVAAVPGAKGVAAKLVRHAERWGKREGCNTVHTYIRMKNYQSIFLFKKMGYTFFEPTSKAMRYAGNNVHYLYRNL